jgi:hypothetical protein
VAAEVKIAGGVQAAEKQTMSLPLKEPLAANGMASAI